MEEYRIRRAEDRDQPDVVRLLEQMFEGDVSDRLAWLYQQNPHGKAISWVAADASGETVGVTSIFPRKVSVSGRVRMGSIGGDCYIAPAARRKGLATRLHMATRGGMTEGGVEFMYGPPLARNLGALLKAGSRAVGALRRHIRPLTKEAVIEAVTRKLPFLAPGSRFIGPPIRLFDGLLGASARGLSLRLVNEFDSAFDYLLNTPPTARICPVRDREFLSWRYLLPNLPTMYPFAVERRGEVVGFAALETKDHTAVVVDLYAQSELVQSATLVLLSQFARELGCTHIDVYRTGGGLSLRQLRFQGFAGREERVFQVMVPEDAQQLELLMEPSAWNFTEGDKDSPTSFSKEPT